MDMQSIIQMSTSPFVAVAGNFGDVRLQNLSYDPPKTVDLLNAKIRSMILKNVHGIKFINADVRFTPDVKTFSFSEAIRIESCSDITFDHGAITGGLAVNGVAETATALDGTGNVIGRPTGHAVGIGKSVNISIRDLTISSFCRGIMFGGVKSSEVIGCHISKLRKTAIGGADVHSLRIEHNTLGTSDPWRWGQTPVGDHADCLAFWSDAKQTEPNQGVVICNNRFIQPNTLPNILGMWFQGTVAAPFIDFVISDNLFILDNLQAVALRGCQDGDVFNNVMLHNGTNIKQAPGILLTAGTHDVSVTQNLCSQVANLGKLPNNIVDNDLRRVVY